MADTICPDNHDQNDLNDQNNQNNQNDQNDHDEQYNDHPLALFATQTSVVRTIEAGHEVFRKYYVTNTNTYTYTTITVINTKPTP